MGVYFFDSYAIIEIVKKNPNYSFYTESDIILTKLNIFEIFYNLLIQVGEKKASEVSDELISYVIDFSINDIKEAAKLKINHKNLSMTDCIGYVLAKRSGVKFLTGDKEFKDLDNVEFVV